MMMMRLAAAGSKSSVVDVLSPRQWKGAAVVVVGGCTPSFASALPSSVKAAFCAARHKINSTAKALTKIRLTRD